MEPTLTDATLQKLARLARIRLDKTEIPKLRQGIKEILEWMEKLEEVDTSDTEPMISLHDRHTLISGQAEPKIQEPMEHALQHAASQPDTPEGFFSVPRIVE